MKMDNPHQGPHQGPHHGMADHQDHDLLHFTPITFRDTLPPAPPGAMPPAPTQPLFRTLKRDDEWDDRRNDEQDSHSNSREVIPVYFDRDLPAPTTLDTARRRQHARDLIDCDIDVRFASAREMATASLELYVRALISWDAYARLAFQPELHPDYDTTIGALLGVQAEPDKPQDFIRLWEERLAYERRYSVADAKRVRATERITLIMRRLAGIPSLRA